MQTLRTFQKLSGFSTFMGVRGFDFSTSQAVLGTTPQQLKTMQEEAKKKGAMSSKYIKLAQGAVTLGGGETDPKVNKHLAQVIDQAVRDGVMKKSLLNSIIVKDLESATTYLITVGGMASLIACRARSQNHGKHMLVGRLKKSMFRGAITDTRDLNNFFERKGIILIDHPLSDGRVLTDDESTDLAIEVEAEDVMKEEDGSLKFICSPSTLKTVVDAIEAKGMTVQYSSADYIPIHHFDADEDDKQFYKLFLQLLRKKDSPAERQCEYFEIVNNFE